MILQKMYLRPEKQHIWLIHLGPNILSSRSDLEFLSPSFSYIPVETRTIFFLYNCSSFLAYFSIELNPVLLLYRVASSASDRLVEWCAVFSFDHFSPLFA